MTPSSLSEIETSEPSAVDLPLLSFTGWQNDATIGIADQVGAHEHYSRDSRHRRRARPRCTFRSATTSLAGNVSRSNFAPAIR